MKNAVTLSNPSKHRFGSRKSKSIWLEIGIEKGKLVEKKQIAYGDSFGKAGNVMRELYPKGITPEQMDDALTIVRIVDKLFRIANQKDAFGESPYGDIVGYGLLGEARHRREKSVSKKKESS